MNKLTNVEALSILDQAIAKVTADRQTHAVLQQAIQVLQEAIKGLIPKDS